MRLARTIVIVALCVSVIAACGRRRQPVAAPSAPTPAVEPAPPAPPPPPPTIPDASDTSTSADPLSEDEVFARKTLEELNAEQPLGDAFFDFDQWHVRDDARTALQANADWLRRWKSTRIMIEGHCDARGTSEYNLALGDRRGNAVRSYLVALGIEPERLVVVSKGEEDPFCSGATEECWQQNRRGHFIITAK